MFSEWSQPQQFLEPGQPPQNVLLLEFREGAVRNEALSKTGPPVYDRVFQVQVRAIGQKHSAPIYTLLKITEGAEKPVEHAEYQRFLEPFNRWRAGIEPAIEGVPLQHWPLMTSEIVAAFRDAKVFTVEQLAQAPDTVSNHIRAEFFTWRAKAQSWLDSNKAAGDAQARVELADAKEKIAALEKQVAAMLAAQNKTPQPPRRKKELPDLQATIEDDVSERL